MHRLTDLLQEVPLLKLDQYGHLLRHTLQDVDVDLNNLDMDLDAQVVSLRSRPANIQAVHICTFALQLDAIDTVSQFVERRGELQLDFFTVALSTLRAAGVFQVCSVVINPFRFFRSKTFFVVFFCFDKLSHTLIKWSKP